MADMTERKRAEQAYIELAHDYAANPIGSRDWVIFWNGWRERSELTATPQPADAALVGKLRHQLAQVTDECARLRALSQPAASPMFADNGDDIEARMAHDAENACPACGGSGHMDDVPEEMRKPAAPVAQVQEIVGLWSFLRNVLQQGAAIAADHAEKHYELYSARLDAAAKERESQLASLLAAAQPAQVTTIPDWIPCNPACDPELGGYRTKSCHCEQAKAALAAAPSAKGGA